MRTISQFVAEDPKQLGTQLSKFEQNVVKETASIRATFAQSASDVIDTEAGGVQRTYTVGQCARCNNGAGGTDITVAAPLDKRKGDVVVIRKSTASAIRVFGQNVQVNGATFATFAAGGTALTFRVFFDGAGYWF